MREFKIACERIEATIKWKDLNFEEVKNWLIKQNRNQLKEEENESLANEKRGLIFF